MLIERFETDAEETQERLDSVDSSELRGHRSGRSEAP
jgi:hypothetical protein